MIKMETQMMGNVQVLRAEEIMSKKRASPEASGGSGSDLSLGLQNKDKKEMVGQKKRAEDASVGDGCKRTNKGDTSG
ncbi:hypothetical protein AX774_g2383 [Zancudomyces culisetae]|uniref:Uncharacterized protein n=1 Tax=Zancudomyces culisetae TaxID=1213189 RepID=A0A1R1PSX5_ZANCU|nr:hypothetical protein AX774_g2383 [Zancudomyces culisetae]|eukprot:OMH84095.1 hypothetical protein AX774_g2383 [Zancudomyces culisetae]